MRQRSIHEKFNAFCPLFADSDERPIASGRRLAVGGGDAAIPVIGLQFLTKVKTTEAAITLLANLLTL